MWKPSFPPGALAHLLAVFRVTYSTSTKGGSGRKSRWPSPREALCTEAGGMTASQQRVCSPPWPRHEKACELRQQSTQEPRKQPRGLLTQRMARVPYHRVPCSNRRQPETRLLCCTAHVRWRGRQDGPMKQNAIQYCSRCFVSMEAFLVPRVLGVAARCLEALNN